MRRKKAQEQDIFEAVQEKPLSERMNEDRRLKKEPSFPEDDDNISYALNQLKGVTHAITRIAGPLPDYRGGRFRAWRVFFDPNWRRNGEDGQSSTALAIEGCLCSATKLSRKNRLKYIGIDPMDKSYNCMTVCFYK